MNRAIFSAVTLALSAMVFAGVWTMTAPATAGPTPVVQHIATAALPVSRDIVAPVVGRHPGGVRLAPTTPVDLYYPGCRAVRAAGAAPLYRGQPGYRPEMDGDDDGIACEPHPGA